MTPYLNGLRGIYTPRTLSFLEKRKTGKSSAFDDINGRQISRTYH
jgi:hypothetical protein